MSLGPVHALPISLLAGLAGGAAGLAGWLALALTDFGAGGPLGRTVGWLFLPLGLAAVLLPGAAGFAAAQARLTGGRVDWRGTLAAAAVAGVATLVVFLTLVALGVTVRSLAPVALFCATLTALILHRRVVLP